MLLFWGEKKKTIFNLIAPTKQFRYPETFLFSHPPLSLFWYLHHPPKTCVFFVFILANEDLGFPLKMKTPSSSQDMCFLWVYFGQLRSGIPHENENVLPKSVIACEKNENWFSTFLLSTLVHNTCRQVHTQKLPSPTRHYSSSPNKQKF